MCWFHGTPRMAGSGGSDAASPIPYLFHFSFPLCPDLAVVLSPLGWRRKETLGPSQQASDSSGYRHYCFCPWLIQSSSGKTCCRHCLGHPRKQGGQAACRCQIWSPSPSLRQGVSRHYGRQSLMEQVTGNSSRERVLNREPCGRLPHMQASCWLVCTRTFQVGLE